MNWEAKYHDLLELLEERVHLDTAFKNRDIKRPEYKWRCIEWGVRVDKQFLEDIERLKERHDGTTRKN